MRKLPVRTGITYTLHSTNCCFEWGINKREQKKRWLHDDDHEKIGQFRYWIQIFNWGIWEIYDRNLFSSHTHVQSEYLNRLFHQEMIEEKMTRKILSGWLTTVFHILRETGWKSHGAPLKYFLFKHSLSRAIFNQKLFINSFIIHQQQKKTRKLN